jgi:hypothetical protein
MAISTRKKTLKKKPAATKKTAPKGRAPKSSRKKVSEPVLRSKPSSFNLAAREFEKKNQSAVNIQPPAYEDLGELPEAYGSKKMFLVCRDPHWAFAYWDLTWQQFQDAARSSVDGRVLLQVYSEKGDRLQQIQIFDGTRNWYLHLNQPNHRFYAEIGFYRSEGKFEVICRSQTVSAPRDQVSPDGNGRFVTIPMNFSFGALRDLIRNHMKDGESLAEALARLQEEGFEFPFPVSKGKRLTDDQMNILMGYLGEGDVIRRIQNGSEEITEMLKRRFQEMQSSGQWKSSEWVTSLSSPFGGGKDRNFFMHVNAELIIYGGTDPKAKVRIDGSEIKLREDGTFSYHFVLPDGKFFIPIEATSPDEVETRSAMLSFMRCSDYAGDVKKTGQPPLPEPIGRTK